MKADHALNPSSCRASKISYTISAVLICDIIYHLGLSIVYFALAIHLDKS